MGIKELENKALRKLRPNIEERKMNEGEQVPRLEFLLKFLRHPC